MIDYSFYVSVGLAIGVLAFLMRFGRSASTTPSQNLMGSKDEPEEADFLTNLVQYTESQLDLLSKFEAHCGEFGPQELKDVERRLIDTRASLKATLRHLKESQSRIRATYTKSVRQQGPMVPGGGGFGRAIRFAQTVERSSRRANLDASLQPWLDAQHRVEDLRNAIDLMLLRLKSLR